ncbi:DUF2905 domain-containing protein [Legionella sp. PATHC038]|uniref:DUF2905 domain-containing protein n=1 Tax=Legionella sheltonii TaxID=2992041 RepID=UPI002243FDFE|nr:DUF2905 domain-containing protein [Legionella sp. PATHC038]MCW8399930.1 DUF2905 domain-containing protein [Legionella sp. PATHC038]
MGLGKLPGDVIIQKNNFTFYFPITTCILISLVITLIFWFSLNSHYLKSLTTI